MNFFQSYVFLLLVSSQVSLGAVGKGCSLFTSDGIAGGAFSHYRLYDFRHIPQKKSKSTPTQQLASKVVNDQSWLDDWYIRETERGSTGPPVIPVWFMKKHVSIVKSNDSSPNYSTYLSLTTKRAYESDQEGAEIIYTEHNISYASMRVKMRFSGATGAVAGMFTYADDTNESDIELRTRDADNIVHYSNQPTSSGSPNWTPVPGASVNRTIQEGQKWTDWHVHRIDWVPGRSAFWLDGNLMNDTTLNVPALNPPSRFYLDIFSQNSSWSGSMPLGETAVLDVQWIQLLFNTSENASILNGSLCVPDAGDLIPAKSGALSTASFRPISWMSLVATLLGLIVEI